ncbi:hypothetical protein [Streptomyces sp. NPDC054854]
MQQFLGQFLGGFGQAGPATGPAQREQAEDGVGSPRVQRRSSLLGSGEKRVRIEEKWCGGVIPAA